MWPFKNKPLEALSRDPRPKQLACVRVMLREPFGPHEGVEGPSVLGYFREFGLVGSTEASKETVASFVDDGEILWAESELNEVNPRDLERSLKRAIRPIEGGVWYVSGRAYFTEEE